jgi:hypothetical protein
VAARGGSGETRGRERIVGGGAPRQRFLRMSLVVLQNKIETREPAGTRSGLRAELSQSFGFVAVTSRASSFRLASRLASFAKLLNM